MKTLLASLFVTFLITTATAQEYRVITTIESVVPGGLGRSRIIDTKTQANYQDYTTTRTDGKKSDQSDIKREDLKVEAFDETKLLNFYSLVGINFQNVASNDALMTSRLNEMAKEGWTLVFVTSGVESDSGKDDGNAIFITRYIFKKG